MRLRTYPIKSLTIFMAVAFTVSLGMIILMIFLSDELFIVRLVVWIMCGVFVILSSIILFDQLFHYFEIKGEYLIKKRLFNSTKIKIKKISHVRVKDRTYFIHSEGKSLAEIPTEIVGADSIILYLEKQGVKVDWGGNIK